MAIRNIRKGEDEVLRAKCKPEPEVTDGVRRLIGDMFDTLYAAQGVGLAAPQIGIVKRIVVIDDYDGHRYALINPVIVSREGEQLSNEGCLSLPGYHGQVRRPQRVLVKALDEAGKEIAIQGEGFLAVILCHEIDHLDGILYKDVAEVYTVLEDAGEGRTQKNGKRPGR